MERNDSNQRPPYPKDQEGCPRPAWAPTGVSTPAQGRPSGSSTPGFRGLDSQPNQTAAGGVLEELEIVRSRERQLMALLCCDDPEKIIHQVRNLQNNVALLSELLKRLRADPGRGSCVPANRDPGASPSDPASPGKN